MSSREDRRRFLQMLAFGAGGAALGLSCSSPSNSASDSAGDTPPGQTRGEDRGDGKGDGPTQPGPPDERTLVMIELGGGNDGLDTIVPYGDDAYGDLRREEGVDLDAVIPIDEEVGYNPNLSRLADRGLAIVQGVGTTEPDLSHFESMRRWWQGDVTGKAGLGSGFLGRLCDQLDTGAPVTGVSVSYGPSPALQSERSVTLSLPEPDSGGWLLDGDPAMDAFRQGFRGLSQGAPGSPPLVARTRRGVSQAIEFLEVLAQLPEPTDAYPGGDLAARLAFAGRLITAGAGIRVIHVPFGDFDTHDGHRWRHDELLAELDEAVDAFLNDVATRGRAESTLVATFSEFGRRPAENAGGTDHGTASVALVAGPIPVRRHGVYPSLTDLDSDGNLGTTMGLDTYYSGIAEGWFGVPSLEVLPGTPAPLADLVP